MSQGCKGLTRPTPTFTFEDVKIGTNNRKILSDSFP